jgi:hypothetical protein
MVIKLQGDTYGFRARPCCKRGYHRRINATGHCHDDPLAAQIRAQLKI